MLQSVVNSVTAGSSFPIRKIILQILPSNYSRPLHAATNHYPRPRCPVKFWLKLLFLACLVVEDNTISACQSPIEIIDMYNTPP